MQESQSLATEPRIGDAVLYRMSCGDDPQRFRAVQSALGNTAGLTVQGEIFAYADGVATITAVVDGQPRNFANRDRDDAGSLPGTWRLIKPPKASKG